MFKNVSSRPNVKKIKIVCDGAVRRRKRGKAEDCPGCRSLLNKNYDVVKIGQGSKSMSQQIRGASMRWLMSLFFFPLPFNFFSPLL